MLACPWAAVGLCTIWKCQLSVMQPKKTDISKEVQDVNTVFYVLLNPLDSGRDLEGLSVLALSGSSRKQAAKWGDEWGLMWEITFQPFKELLVAGTMFWCVVLLFFMRSYFSQVVKYFNILCHEFEMLKNPKSFFISRDSYWIFCRFRPLGCPNLPLLTVLASYAAGLKTLMFADNVGALLSANAAICPMLIILLSSSRVHTYKAPQQTHTHTQLNTGNALGFFFNDKKKTPEFLNECAKESSKVQSNVLTFKLNKPLRKPQENCNHKIIIAPIHLKKKKA